MKHKESDLQIRCIKWFRYQYPEFARLMYHPRNEGKATRRQGGIAKAEGVTAGVADVILQLPSYTATPTTLTESTPLSPVCCDAIATPKRTYLSEYTALALELKTPKGTQSPEQKSWQRLFEASGGRYVIVRDYDTFVSEVTNHMLNVPISVFQAVKDTYHALQKEENDKLVKALKKL